MDRDIEISIDDNRLTIRKVLLEVVKKLNKEDGMTLRDIIAEMLVISSIVVSDENCEITELNDLSEEYEEGTDINQNYEASYNQGSYHVRQKDMDYVSQTEIYKKYQKLRDEIFRHRQLNHYEETLKSAMELLNIMPEYYKTLVLHHCELWCSFKYNYHLIDYTMKAYVVLMDKDKINDVMTLVKKIHSIIGDKEIDIEMIEQDFKLRYNDISIMENIYDFLKSHPKYLQKNIYKALSIEGKKTAYMFEYAENYGKISRIRHKDSWLLTYNT